MKRTSVALCIMLGGCYATPTGLMYYPQETQFHQELVYHYQVPPPNPYYNPTTPTYDPPNRAYNDCVRRNAERYNFVDSENLKYQMPPEDCGVYMR